MKAYISIKFREDNSNKDCIQKISSALERSGFETVCVARDIENWGEAEFSPADLMQRSFSAIESSDVFVVDLSEKGVGLGIEAGYAHAVKVPIASNRKRGFRHFNDATGDFEEAVFVRNIRRSCTLF